MLHANAETTLDIPSGTGNVKIQELFAPPKAPLETGNPVGTQATGTRFPWLFVLRFVVGAYVLLSALLGLYGLSQSWAQLADRSFIDPVFSPYRYLPVILLKIATGIAILARRRVSLILTLLWAIAFLVLMWGNGPLRNLGADFLLNLACILGLFAFQCLLLTRRLLR